MAAQIMATPLKWLIVLAPLGFVFAMSIGANRMRTSTLQIMFWGFCTAMGLSMSTIFLGLHRRFDRDDVLRHGGRLRGPQPLWLFDQA